MRSVASAIGVSTTPARDALNRLLVEGALIYAGPKNGGLVPLLTQGALDEITVTRLALEPLAAERSVGVTSNLDISELEKLQELIKQGLQSGEYRQVLRANRSFHFLLYRRSNWPRVVSLIEGLWLQIGPYFICLYPEFAITQHGVAAHTKILQGLRKKDSLLVRAGVEQDLRDGYDRLSRYVANSTGTR
ncbi:DNA-binding GntR family transcriptional regulator [Bradyrhizobium sp. GM6.1]